MDFVLITVVPIVLLNSIVFVSSDISSHPAWQIIDKHYCGETVTDRIIGGTAASLGQFPWISLLGYSFKSSLALDGTKIDRLVQDMEWLCGGSLITDRHVLTAAHCTATGLPKLAAVRLGEHDLSKDVDCGPSVCAPKVQNIKVKKYINHPQYDKPPLNNDISLLVLDTPLQLNDYVVPICLPRTPEQKLKPHENVTIAGWGTLNITTQKRPTILQYVQVPVLGSVECEVFKKNFNITAGQICAGAQYNKDSCQGDSGGPVSKVLDTEEGPKHYLYGVVSFGPLKCGMRKPGVYTSVSHYLPWILDQIYQNPN